MRDGGVQYASEQERNQSINVFVDDVISIEYELASAINRSKPSEDPFIDESQMTLAELGRQAPGIDWCGIVSYAFDDSSVDCETNVIVYEKEHFIEVSRYIQALASQGVAVQRRILHHYLMWRLISTFVDDISKLS